MSISNTDIISSDIISNNEPLVIHFKYRLLISSHKMEASDGFTTEARPLPANFAE